MEPSSQYRSLQPQPRLRYSNGFISTPNPEERTFKTYCNASWQNNGNYAGPRINGVKRTMNDFVIPRFNARRANGEVFFTNMTKSEVTVTTNGGSYLVSHVNDACPSMPGVKPFWRPVGGVTGVQYWLPSSAADEKGIVIPPIVTVISDDELARVKIQVSTEVLAKRGVADSDLWESLAEYKQTLALLDEPLSRLGRVVSDAASSIERNRFARDSLNRVAGGYLLYRYGISPLVKDIQNVLAGLKKASGQKRVTKRASETLHAFQSIAGSVTSPAYLKVDHSNVVTDSVSIRGMSLDAGTISLANNLGLSSKGLITLPWQLMSYSFVADWFLNIGDYLQSQVPAFGWTALGSCLVTRRTTSNVYTLGQVTVLDPQWVHHIKPSGSISVTRVETVREPLAKSGVVVQSDFKFDSITRSLDALALIVTGINRISAKVEPVVPDTEARQKAAVSSWFKTISRK